MSDNEHENENRETVADIVAEMRRMGNYQRYSGDHAHALADRIEAAWKRDEERAVEHATRHAESVARDNCRDCVHNPNGKNYQPVTDSHAVGNAAAMREALEFADRELRRATEDSRYGDDVVYLVGCMRTVAAACRDALSSPERNCDRYKDAPSAFADFFVPWKQDRHINDVPTLQDFANWLFALSADRKGEDDAI